MSQPTPDELRILITAPRDSKALKRILRTDGEVALWLIRVAESLWRRRATLRARFSEADFAAQLIGELWEKLTRLQDPGAIDDPAAFLARMMRNLAEDINRRYRAKKRGAGVDDAELDERFAEGMAPAPDSALIAEQRLERLMRDCRDPSALPSPLLRAFFIAFVEPSRVDHALLAEAGDGFIRGPDASLPLVAAHLNSALPPIVDDNAKRALAWIARCQEALTDVESWPDWLAHDAKAARSGLDTTQKNYRRALQRLIAYQREQGDIA